MKQRIGLGLATVGAAVCVGTAIAFPLFEPSCRVPALVLVQLAALGPAGAAAAVLGVKRMSPRWLDAAWAVCGGLSALVVIGVWSVGPWVLLALLALGTALILGGRRMTRKTRRTLSILVASALVNFGLLFALAKDTGIEVVPLPAGSPVAHAFPRLDYADAYRAELPSGRRHDVDSITRAWLNAVFPCWPRWLRSQPDRLPQTFREGGPAISGRVYHRSTDEIVLGNDASHLDYRVSILLTQEGGVQWVTVSTVVRYNNWRGRAYFVPVRVGHQIIIPQTLRTMIGKFGAAGN